MSDIPSGTFVGEGDALVVNKKCNKLIPFTSSYKWTNGGVGTNYFLAIIDYQNSIIGKRKFNAVFNINNYNPYSIWSELGFDGTLNYNTAYYYDSDLETDFIAISIYGKFKTCDYSSEELCYNVLSPSSASARESLKKKSGNSEQFHKLLDSNPNLKKKYLKIKAKLGK